MATIASSSRLNGIFPDLHRSAKQNNLAIYGRIFVFDSVAKLERGLSKLDSVNKKLLPSKKF